MNPAIEASFETADGLDLHLGIFPEREAARPPRGVVVLTHGHGEHFRRYLHVIQAMNAADFAVVAYDLRGHGESDGPRGHCPRFESYLDDLRGVRRIAENRFPHRPVFLFGHSLGGMITLAGALVDPGVRGVLVNAPALRMAYLPPAWKILLARVFSRLLPQLAQKTGLADSALSSDGPFLAALPQPELRHTLMSARLGMEMLTRGARLIADAGAFRCPVLITHGEADPVIDPAGSRAFYQACGAVDKTLRTFPGLRHETQNDAGRDEVIATWVRWLEARA